MYCRTSPLTLMYCVFVFRSSGLGQITIPREWPGFFKLLGVDMAVILFKAFVRAGFAQYKDEHELLPCPTGTIVNSFERDPTKLECLKCPAGINNLTIHQILHQIPAVQALITFC